MIAALGTVLGVVTGALQLSKALRSPPVAASITVSKTVELDVRWRDYHAAHPEVPAGPNAINVYGVVFTVALELKGLKGKKPTLRWRALDGGGVAIDSLSVWAPRSLELAPDQDPWQVTKQVWSPLPAHVDEFQLEFGVDTGHERRATEISPKVALGNS